MRSRHVRGPVSGVRLPGQSGSALRPRVGVRSPGTSGRGFGVVALQREQHGELRHGARHLGMIVAENFMPPIQDLAQNPLGLGIEGQVRHHLGQRLPWRTRLQQRWVTSPLLSLSSLELSERVCTRSTSRFHRVRGQATCPCRSRSMDCRHRLCGAANPVRDPGHAASRHVPLSSNRTSAVQSAGHYCQLFPNTGMTTRTPASWPICSSTLGLTDVSRKIALTCSLLIRATSWARC